MYVLTYPCVCRYTCVGGRVCTDVHGKVEAMGHPWVLYPSRTPPCLLTLFFPDKSMNHLYYNFLFLSYISFFRITSLALLALYKFVQTLKVKAS